jgi:COMPASS component SWD2
LACGRILKDHAGRVSSCDFTLDGEYLLTSGEDCRICLYSCQKGELDRTVVSKSHGCALARFTHDPLSVIATSAKDPTVRYLSLHDNRYLREFRGHTDAVISLQMSPKDDSFTTAAADNTARIWDLRSANCQGVMRFDGSGHRPAAAFDPDGVVFAAALSSGCIKLFDVRTYTKGPFTTFTAGGAPASCSCLKFSSDGKKMLIGAPGRVLCLDAYTGDLLQTFTGHANDQQQPLEACFSPDGEHVLSGSEDGTIWRWKTETAELLPALTGHEGAVTAVKCNPTRDMLASASTEVRLWIPPPTESSACATGAAAAGGFARARAY